MQFMYKSPSFEDQVKPQLHMRPCLCWVFPCLSCLKSTCLNETWLPDTLFQALLQENPDLNTLHMQSTSLRVSKSIHLPSTLSLPLFGFVCLFIFLSCSYLVYFSTSLVSLVPILFFQHILFIATKIVFQNTNLMLSLPSINFYWV